MSKESVRLPVVAAKVGFEHHPQHVDVACLGGRAGLDGDFGFVLVHIVRGLEFLAGVLPVAVVDLFEEPIRFEGPTQILLIAGFLFL